MAQMRIPTEIRWVWGRNIRGRETKVKHIWNGDPGYRYDTLCDAFVYEPVKIAKDDPLSSVPVCKTCKRILTDAFERVEMLSEKGVK
jgi:hypothetical protein